MHMMNLTVRGVKKAIEVKSKPKILNIKVEYVLDNDG